jgi:hypothetical protein
VGKYFKLGKYIRVFYKEIGWLLLEAINVLEKSNERLSTEGQLKTKCKSPRFS